VVAVTDPAALDAALIAVRELVERVDQACSSFRSDSELAALNRAAGTEIEVSPLLLEYLEAGVRAAEVTAGDVDPTVGQALLALGFTGESAGARTTPRFTLQAVPGYQAIELNRQSGTARLARGVRVDLGATAKALAADQAAAAARRATGAGVLVSLSGDLSIVGPPPEGGWRVRVTDDHRSDPSVPGQWISLTTGGLASSSTTVRGRGHGPERVHHMIDPATGAPASVRFRTVSVAAASCLDANIASTAAIVRGERAVPWLEALELPSRLVGLDGGVQHLSGWPVEDEELPISPPRVAA
jgi:thiamine biosynthesis lipoprotein